MNKQSRVGTMINFRATDEYLTALDRAAAVAGLTRSDFMRSELTAAIHRWTGQSVASITPSISNVILPSSPKIVIGNDSGTKTECDGSHPKNLLMRLPTGVKVCVCGAKLR